MSESEIADLCRRIYRKHKQAIDLILEHRPDQLLMIQEFVQSLVRENDTLFDLDHSVKSYIRFAPRAWDKANVGVGQGWTQSGRILLFEVVNTEGSLRLKLEMGPGPVEIRQRLFDMALQNPSLFRPASQALGPKWNQIFTRTFLSRKSYVDASEEDLKENIRTQWNKFLESDFPKINDAIISVLFGG